MKKDYIVELREEEADELMDDHWVGELVRCKECKKQGSYDCHITSLTGQTSSNDWFCADGERKD